jgi:hypothetical protein
MIGDGVSRNLIDPTGNPVSLFNLTGLGVNLNKYFLDDVFRSRPVPDLRCNEPDKLAE